MKIEKFVNDFGKLFIDKWEKGNRDSTIYLQSKWIKNELKKLLEKASKELSEENKIIIIDD